MKYVFSSAVITSPGTYNYRLISIDEAREFLKDKKYISTIGYRETAIAFNKIFGTRIPVNRHTTKMKVGDRALVFRLKSRVAMEKMKGNIGIDYIISNLEIGMLERIM